MPHHLMEAARVLRRLYGRHPVLELGGAAEAHLVRGRLGLGLGLGLGFGFGFGLGLGLGFGLGFGFG